MSNKLVEEFLQEEGIRGTNHLIEDFLQEARFGCTIKEFEEEKLSDPRFVELVKKGTSPQNHQSMERAISFVQNVARQSYEGEPCSKISYERCEKIVNKILEM